MIDKQIPEALARTQAILKDEMASSNYNKYIADLTITSHTDQSISLHAPGQYEADWLNARMGKIMSQHFSGILGQPMEILFSANGDPGPDLKLSKGRKADLSQAYGETRASIIQPQKALYITNYFWRHWRPLLGKGTTSDVVIACRSLCYWNIKTGELRNTITTDRDEIAELAVCSPSSVDRALSHQLVRMYFVRKKIARVMTDEGPRNHGLILKVRMDDPLIPEHQKLHKINEPMAWVDPYVPE